MEWQGVTNFEESAENYLGRILLSGRVRGMAGTGEVSPRSRTEEHGGEGGRVRCGAEVETRSKSVSETGWAMRYRWSVLAGGTGWPGGRGMIGAR